MKTDNSSFERVEQLRYLVTISTNQNYIQEEINPLNPVLVLVPSSLSSQQSGRGSSTNTIFINFLKKKVLGVLASGLYH